MTTMTFEDTVSELVHHISEATPKDKQIAWQELRRAIDTADEMAPRQEVACDDDGNDLFNNVPV